MHHCHTSANALPFVILIQLTPVHLLHSCQRCVSHNRPLCISYTVDTHLVHRRLSEDCRMVQSMSREDGKLISEGLLRSNNSGIEAGMFACTSVVLEALSELEASGREYYTLAEALNKLALQVRRCPCTRILFQFTPSMSSV